MMLTEMLELLIVGLCWGVTNPFLRRATTGIQHIDTGSKWRNMWLEFRLVTARMGNLLPYLLNQAGSVLYVWALQHIGIVVAVSVTNSLTFCFTAITGYFLGERIPGKRILCGTLLVCLGVSLIIYDAALKEVAS